LAVKNGLVAGTFSTSSWLGMNFRAGHVARLAPERQRAAHHRRRSLRHSRAPGLVRTHRRSRRPAGPFSTAANGRHGCGRLPTMEPWPAAAGANRATVTRAKFMPSQELVENVPATSRIFTASTPAREHHERGQPGALARGQQRDQHPARREQRRRRRQLRAARTPSTGAPAGQEQRGPRQGSGRGDLRTDVVDV